MSPHALHGYGSETEIRSIEFEEAKNKLTRYDINVSILPVVIVTFGDIIRQIVLGADFVQLVEFDREDMRRFL